MGIITTHYQIKDQYEFCFSPIDTFNEARGHSIERENYIKDLNKANWNDNLRLLQQNGGEDEILVGGKIEEPSPFC